LLLLKKSPLFWLLFSGEAEKSNRRHAQWHLCAATSAPGEQALSRTKKKSSKPNTVRKTLQLLANQNSAPIHISQKKKI
jgi:hypothetical protein